MSCATCRCCCYTVVVAHLPMCQPRPLSQCLPGLCQQHAPLLLLPMSGSAATVQDNCPPNSLPDLGTVLLRMLLLLSNGCPASSAAATVSRSQQKALTEFTEAFTAERCCRHWAVSTPRTPVEGPSGACWGRTAQCCPPAVLVACCCCCCCCRTYDGCRSCPHLLLLRTLCVQQLHVHGC
jgi:hypothetical protein